MDDIIPRPELKKAVDLAGIPDAFEALPLSTPEEMEKFFVETMEARTGDEYESPIDILEDAFRKPREHNSFLLLGHRGCGKSTELNRMKLRLKNERPVEIILCELELYLENQPDYTDLLILMGQHLLSMAKELGVRPKAETVKLLETFWTPETQITDVVSEAETELSGGVKLASPGFFQSVLNLALNVRDDLKYNETKRSTYEQTIHGHFRDWRRAVNGLSDAIREKTRKQPVLIFEDLDKLEPDAAKNIFFLHAQKLSAFSFPVVYTFPIALAYDSSFRQMDSYFHVEIFPMLKIRSNDPERSLYQAGWDRLTEIVHQRVEPGLIDTNALNLMIAKTGGSLRDLFRVIRTASQRAAHRARRTGNPNETITLEDAQRALIRMQSDITRLIQGKDHEFLAKIVTENQREIEDEVTLLRMLQARTVLEYNGKRWYGLHPLVEDYLRELGYLT